MARDPARYALAVLAAIPALVLFATDTYYTFTDLNDECIRWGAEGNQSVPMPTEGPCAGRAASQSATKAEWVTRYLLIEGAVLLGLGLGVAGLVAGRLWLAVSGGLVLVVVTVPLLLGSAGFLTLASSLMILGSAYWTRSRVRIPPPPAPPKAIKPAPKRLK